MGVEEQRSHGFNVLDVVFKTSSGKYLKVNPTTPEYVQYYLVDAIYDCDTFSVTCSGGASILFPAHGLTLQQNYYVNPIAPGGLSADPPHPNSPPFVRPVTPHSQNGG